MKLLTEAKLRRMLARAYAEGYQHSCDDITNGAVSFDKEKRDKFIDKLVPEADKMD